MSSKFAVGRFAANEGSNCRKPPQFQSVALKGKVSIMGELRNRLDRKNELRLYEWMKNGENYGKLSDKTVTEGAEAVSRELDLKVSGSVLTSLVQAMGLDPFWKVRQQGGKRESGDRLAEIQKVLASNAKRLDEHSHGIDQLKEVCRNLIERLERIERHERPQRRTNANNMDGPVDRQ